MPENDRRGFLKKVGTLTGSPVVYSSVSKGYLRDPPDNPERDPPEKELEGFFEFESEFFSAVFIEQFGTYGTNSDGDLWPSCWADDDNVYAANGDGEGFGLGEGFSDIVMNRVKGTPESGITGDRLASGDEIGNIWADPDNYNRKPTGMVAVDSDEDGNDELYVAVQDLHTPPCPLCFNDAPNASISKSEDYGETWQKTNEPMFSDYRFTTIFFLDYGKSYENVQVLGEEATDYVYAYGLDNNWRDSFSDTVPDPQNLYLARVPKQSIQDRSTWKFYKSTRSNGRPTWSPDIDQREPVLHDERRVYSNLRGDSYPEKMSVLSQGSVVYNEPLDRYIYTSWTEYSFEFYEAPQPWGPWKLFKREDFGGYPWFGKSDNTGCRGPKNGGYATTVPSKFISEDGKNMWVQSNWFVGVGCGSPNYELSLRKFNVEPYDRTVARNDPNPTNNLAMTGSGTTPIDKSAHYGNVEYYNDEIKTHSEDSFDGTNKRLDFWGYTWDEIYTIDEVAYTTGNMFPDGGWFSDEDGKLKVQVRQDFEWIDVSDLAIKPEYPYDDSAGPNNTYELSFRDTWGDGVRIIGQPGGSAHFTSIGELEVYFNDRNRRGSPLGRRPHRVGDE